MKEKILEWNKELGEELFSLKYKKDCIVFKDDFDDDDEYYPFKFYYNSLLILEYGTETNNIAESNIIEILEYFENYNNNKIIKNVRLYYQLGYNNKRNEFSNKIKEIKERLKLKRFLEL